jgi:bis(5'-nucleosyl)-tetraphosphatase (symmetrical)
MRTSPRPSTTWSPRPSKLATYAIGDLQGCYEPLQRLVDAIGFDPARDRLWFTGDLVNRGPQSLQCLRYVKSLGAAAVTVFGNHDFHLLCIAEGVEQKKKRDTLEEVLHAPDRDELLDWLRRRPLMHAEDGFVLVHAGVLPEWSVDRALSLASEVESMLRGEDYRVLLARMYGDEPRRWSDTLTGIERLRVVINAMTRLRMMDHDGAMVLPFKGKPADAPAGTMPWFDFPQRASRDHTVIFGHWSALGRMVRDDVVCLDSGCVWGRSLSAIRLSDRQLYSVDCAPG